uniref:FBD domain-containing protein n=1 Tax=Aegilops tauschii TaxID=37682 RepID=M8BA26_AEGTA
MNEASTGERGTLELPCFEKATKVVLDLHSIGLTLPPSGEFTRLTDLELVRIQLHGPCSLSDVVSSPRCPSLLRLSVCGVRGLDKLAIHSESLLQLELSGLHTLQQLNIVALSLQKLKVKLCFTDAPNQSQPVADISAPQLAVCGDKRFLMEEMTKLPNITTLGLVVLACGHSFGAGAFHVLKMSSGIRELTLQLVTRSDCKAFAACQSGCICVEPSNWETEDLVLPCLKELAINDLRGTERELALVKRLLKWARMLERVAVIFHDSIAESNREEFRRLLLSFSRPAICMKFSHG